MTKPIALVTGASSGIGQQTALELARRGYFVIIHGRNRAKTERVLNTIRQQTGSTNLDMICADLSLMSGVAAMAAELRSHYDHLDVLINNAGGQFGNRREVTSEGHEKTIAINALAPFLLTHLLLPLLQAAPAARVITVSSGSYTIGRFDPDDIELTRGYSLTRSYGLSKRYAYWVMQKYTAQGIAGVTFNTVEPGSTDSDLGRVSRQSKLANLVYYLWKPMMWSVEKAAATSVYLATAPEVAGVNGTFYGNRKPKRVKAKYQQPAEMDRFWDYCREVCKAYL